VAVGVEEGIGVRVAVGGALGVGGGPAQAAATSMSSGPKVIANGFMRKAGE